MKLSDIKPNPKNPRVIKDDRFKALKESISKFPKMMALRPIVVDDYGIILGGNMRYRALAQGSASGNQSEGGVRSDHAAQNGVQTK